MVSEKRRERRVAVDLPVKIILGDIEAEGRVKNISRLGAYFEVSTKISVGAVIDLFLEIPVYAKKLSLAGEVRCRGEVFRSAESRKRYGIGVFFVDFPEPSGRDKLSGYLDFLVQTEDKTIQKGIKYWDKKRGKGREVSRGSQGKEKRESRHTEIINLLQRVLSRLDEISCQLKAQGKE